MDAKHLAAALVSPYATWTPEAPDEEALLAVLRAHGSPPQADLFEPWEPDEPWSARVLWPDLETPGGVEALLVHGPLEDGDPPGFTEWLDRGRIGLDILATDGLIAECASDLEQGGLLIPDLVHHETTDRGIIALAQQILVACGALTDRDQVTLVEHRSTGRMGLLVELAVPDRDPDAERHAAIEAIGGVVASVPGPALSPRARWWYDHQRLTILLHLVARSMPRVPVDRFEPRTFPGGEGRFELHVLLPEAPEEVAALSETLGAVGMVGSRARWSTLDGRRVFLTAWTGSPEEPVDIARPHRWVPAIPSELHGESTGIDPSWWTHAGRTVCRWHCAMRDRDLLPVCTSRTGDELDRSIAAALAHLGEVEPVSAGRPAIRVRIPPQAPWESVVQALCEVGGHHIADSVHVAFRQKTVALLYRADGEAEEVQWTGT